MKPTNEERRQLALFREWIRGIQARTGHSQSSLAEAAGLAPSTINRPMGEGGTKVPKWATILKIAEAVRVDPPEALAPVELAASQPAKVDEAKASGHHESQQALGEDEGMRSTDIEILSQLVDDYGVAEVVRQLRLLPEKPGSGKKRGLGS